MAMQLGITREKAVEMKDTFFKTYPAIFDNIMFCHGYAKEMGHTFTMFGRMRRLHRIGSSLSDNKVIAQEERQAYNTHIQGSAAEIMKLAMLLVDTDPELQSLGAELVMTVHDELVAECPNDTSKDAAERMGQLMGDPLHLGPIQMQYPVPITPDIGRAQRWSQAK
jgi:DNA polymerase-1